MTRARFIPLWLYAIGTIFYLWWWTSMRIYCGIVLEIQYKTKCSYSRNTGHKAKVRGILSSRRQTPLLASALRATLGTEIYAQAGALPSYRLVPNVELCPAEGFCSVSGFIQQEASAQHGALSNLMLCSSGYFCKSRYLCSSGGILQTALSRATYIPLICTTKQLMVKGLTLGLSNGSWA